MPELGERERPMPLEYPGHLKGSGLDTVAVSLTAILSGMIFAFALFFALLFMLSQSDLRLASEINRAGSQPFRPTPWTAYLGFVGVIGGGVVVGSLLMIKRRSREAGLGIVIGLGLAMLLYGLCFKVLGG